jgi:lactoylglutathione lyase
MEESLHFYKEIVGLKENRRFPAGPGVEISFLGEGSTQIELIHDEKLKEINLGEDISWGFQVESVDAMMTSVREKGIEVHSGPFQPNPHTRYFFVKDPNGLKIQFVEMS